jgi:hypothetical protein
MRGGTMRPIVLFLSEAKALVTEHNIAPKTLWLF